MMGNRKLSIMNTSTNVRSLMWPVVLAPPARESCLAAAVTMEADCPEMTGRFDSGVLEAQ